MISVNYGLSFGLLNYRCEQYTNAFLRRDANIVGHLPTVNRTKTLIVDLTLFYHPSGTLFLISFWIKHQLTIDCDTRRDTAK